LERREYDKLLVVEDTMWWFRGLHANLLATYRLRNQNSTGRIIDIGCGTGGLLSKIADAVPTAWSMGLDMDEAAAGVARAKAARPVCVGSVNALPFESEVFDVVFSADVLCHAGVDEEQAVREFYRCLSPDGILVLNLPAYPWLLSDHDHAVSNVRRFTRKGTRSLLDKAGFADIRVVHWNSILFPLMLVRRMLVSSGGRSDVEAYPRPIEYIFRSTMRLENLLLRHGIGLPFGGSVLASAKRP